MKKQIHKHSRISYEQLLKDLGDRQQRILIYIVDQKKAQTDRQIKEGLGYHDMNQVRPRVSELLKKGIIRECKPIKCPVTDRLVRRVIR